MTTVEISKQRHQHLEEFCKIFAPEYDKPELHDRVLVLQVTKEVSLSRNSGNLSTLTKGKLFDSWKPATLKRTWTEMNVTRNDEDIVLPALCTPVEILKAKIKRRSNQRIRFRNLSIVHSIDSRFTEEMGIYDDDDDSSEKTVILERKLYVHSCLLAVQSPFFRGLVCSGVNEMLSEEDKQVVLQIEKNELEAHLSLIEAMYNMDILDGKAFDHVVQVLVLADKYDVGMVFRKCKDMLISTPLTMERCQHILKITKDFPEYDEFRDVVESFLINEFRPLDDTWTQETFFKLSESMLTVLLSSDRLEVVSENTVFVALIEWIKRNMSTTVAERKSSLLPLVRFELMSIDFLYDVVRNDDLAKRMPNFNQLFQKALAYHGFSQTRRDKLDVSPVQRKPSSNRPAFRWEIYHWNGYSLLAGNLIISREFWCNGYKMEMHLRLSTPKDSYELSLHVLGLKPGSHVNIAWSAHSQLFKTPIDSEKIDHWESVKRNTFTRWKLKREVNVNFKFV